jgi:hypothetical protein
MPVAIPAEKLSGLTWKKISSSLALTANAALPSALAADARDGLDDALDRQIFRQLPRSALRTPPWRPGGLGRCDLGLGLLLGLRLFQVLDRQFELLDEELAALRRLAETLTARLGQLQAIPLNFAGDTPLVASSLGDQVHRKS